MSTSQAMCRVLILVILALTAVNLSSGQTYSNYQTLVSTVLTNYNPDIIPLNDHTQALDVALSAYMYTLQEVDVVAGKVSLIFAVTAQWQDSQITWTPSTYGNLQSIKIPNSKVWRPPFVLGTPLEFTTIGEDWMPVVFLSNGSATLTLGDVIESSCTFNLRFWPFDKHTCDVSFITYGYTMSDVNLTGISAGSVFTTAEIDNIEWKLTDTSWFIQELTDGAQQITFRIKIERRSGIFIIFILFPLYSLACLNGVVFLLPQDSGERVGYSVTMLLATTVFLEVISSFLPNTSNPLPLLCLEVTLGITLSILCLVFVVLSWYFYDRSDDVPMNKAYVTFVKLFNKKFRKSPKVSDNAATKAAFQEDYTRQSGEESRMNPKYGNSSSKADVFVESYSGSTLKGETKRCMPVRPASSRLEDRGTYGRRGSRASGMDENESTFSDTDITWRDVSATIDKVTFVSSMMSHAVITTIFTLYLVLGSN